MLRVAQPSQPILQMTCKAVRQAELRVEVCQPELRLQRVGKLERVNTVGCRKHTFSAKGFRLGREETSWAPGGG